jgi:hypothetical protein
VYVVDWHADPAYYPDLNHEDDEDDPEEIEIRRRVVGAAYSECVRTCS